MQRRLLDVLLVLNNDLILGAIKDERVLVGLLDVRLPLLHRLALWDRYLEHVIVSTRVQHI